MNKLILTLLLIFIISCSSNFKEDYDNDKNLYENNILEDYELFNLANKYIETEKLDLALIELDKIEVLFPSGEYAKKAMLVSAYIYFLKKDYEKTRAIAESYKTYFPGSRDIVYANYLEAMTYYAVIKKSDYTQDNSKIALEKFNFILNAYPNNKYEIDIITKIDIINNNLAKNKLSIAKFYYDRGNVNASLVYLNEIYIDHSSSYSIEETLFLLTKIHLSIDEYELAKKYASILAYNFPESDWYRKSYNILNYLEDVANDKKWFQRYNPIKIFKKEVDDTSNNKLIKSID